MSGHSGSGPFFIGVAGGSGSGKTTVVTRLVDGLGSDATTVVQHDSYYRDMGDVDFDERAATNFDHPDSLETELLIEHLDALKSGDRADVPVYDFENHLRTAETRAVVATRYILVDGILVLSDEELRSRMDLGVYVHTPTEERLRRRIARDVEERGRTRETVIDQFERTVLPMHRQFVEPSRQHADIEVEQGGFNRLAIDSVLRRIAELSASAGG